MRSVVRPLAFLALGTVLLAALTATPSAAQTADEVPGEASASADVIGVNIRTAGITIGYTLGRSLARYQELQASAEARALDLGALPVLFGEAASCDGSTPVLPKSTLPPRTAVDSQAADGAASRRIEARFPAGIGVVGPSAGFQDATATPQPAARALVDTPSQDIGIFALVDPHSEVTTQLVDGTREAHAVTWASKLSMFGGLIVLREPRWEALARSGKIDADVGRFTFTGATVLGVERSFDQATGDVQAFADGLANLLSGLGVHLDYPTVTMDDGRVSVSPLQFRLTDLPVGVNAIGPFLTELQPLREMLFTQLTEQDCKNAQGLQLVDVILQVLSGSGSVAIPVGGVEASTAATSFPAAQVPSAGSSGSDDGSSVLGSVSVSPTSSVEIPSTPAFVASSALDQVPLSSSTGGDAFPAVVESATLDAPSISVARVAASTAGASPQRSAVVAAASEPAGSSSTAVALGIVALVGAAGLAVADVGVMRRGRRRILP